MGRKKDPLIRWRKNDATEVACPVSVPSYHRYLDSSSARGIGKYTGLALLLPISTFVGYGMGYGIDLLFHTTWIRYVFLALGTVSGFISLLRELDKDK